MSSDSIVQPYRRGVLFTLVGPSGVGKTTVLRHMEDRLGAQCAPKYTTRPSRNTEADARDFVFCDAARFPATRILRFESYGHWFGIQLQEIDRSLDCGVCHVIVAGDSDVARRLSEIYGDQMVSIFIFCELSVLRARSFGVGSDRVDRWSRVCNEVEAIYEQFGTVQFVVNNSGSIEDTLMQVDRVWNWVTSAQVGLREVTHG